MTSTSLALAVVAGVWLATPASAFEGIRLTVLGMSAAAVDRGHPAMLIESGDEVVLVDCGPGIVERLYREGVQTSELTAVLLTGLAPELVDGCREIWAIAREGGRQPPSVWGPQGTRAWFAAIDPDSGHDHSENAARDLTDNVVYRSDEVTITAFVTDDAGSGQSVGYRVDAFRRSATLSGHTRYSENLIRYARGSQVLVHDVAAASARAAEAPAVRDALARHASPEDAAKVFGAVRPYLALYAPAMLFGIDEDELLRRTRRIYRGPLEVGRDALVIEIQNEVQLRGSPSDGPRAKH